MHVVQNIIECGYSLHFTMAMIILYEFGIRHVVVIKSALALVIINIENIQHVDLSKLIMITSISKL